jgi:hypothetical protein
LGPSAVERVDGLDAVQTPRPARRTLARDMSPVLAAAAVFVLVWQLVVIVADYPRFILPGPLVVAERFVAGWAEGIIGPHFATTLSEVLLGLLIGGLAGILTGILLARSRLAERLLSPYIVAAQATPIALAPLIALWFGTGLLPPTARRSLLPIAVGRWSASLGRRDSSNWGAACVPLAAVGTSVLGGAPIMGGPRRRHAGVVGDRG